MCQLVLGKYQHAVLLNIEDAATTRYQHRIDPGLLFYLGRHTVGLRLIVSDFAEAYLNAHRVVLG